MFLYSLFACFWLISDSSTAQEYLYFNNRLDLNGMNNVDRSYNVVMNENGYVIAGNSIVYGETIYWWEKAIAKIDYDGQVEYVKYFGEDSVEYFFSYTPDYLIQVGSHYLAAGIRREPASDWFHQEATLMKLDENLDTLWMKRFGEKAEPFDTAYYFASLQEINQNELILTGAWKPEGSATHVYLLKTDSLGNKVWDNSFSFYNFYIEGHSLAQTIDSGFIIGCFKQTPGYPYTVDPVLIKTDSLGNQEWTKNLGEPYKDFTPMVAISTDGNIIVGTSIADSMLTPDVPISRINIVKLDNEGNVFWNKKYGQSQANNFLRKIRILEDGSIIAVGATTKYNPQPDRVGWIIKTTSEGDSLWYREYAYLTGYESRNYLYDVIATNDNGLIACGYVTPYPPDTGSTDTWVIKLDSIGCEWAGCDTTVGVPDDRTVGRYDGRTVRLEVWPNPCSSDVSITLNSSQVGQLDSWQLDKFTLEVYDIFGRKLGDKVFSSTRMWGGREGGWMMDVSALAPGLYLLVVKDGVSVKASAKFVVGR